MWFKWEIRYKLNTKYVGKSKHKEPNKVNIMNQTQLDISGRTNNQSVSDK